MRSGLWETLISYVVISFDAIKCSLKAGKMIMVLSKYQSLFGRSLRNYPCIKIAIMITYIIEQVAEVGLEARFCAWVRSAVMGLFAALGSSTSPWLLAALR